MSIAGVSAPRPSASMVATAQMGAAKVNDHDADDLPAAATKAALPEGQGQTIDKQA